MDYNPYNGLKINIQVLLILFIIVCTYTKRSVKSTFCKNFTESCQREKMEVQKQKKGHRGHTKFNYLVMFNLYFKLDEHLSKAKKKLCH